MVVKERAPSVGGSCRRVCRVVAFPARRPLPDAATAAPSHGTCHTPAEITAAVGGGGEGGEDGHGEGIGSGVFGWFLLLSAAPDDMQGPLALARGGRWRRWEGKRGVRNRRRKVKMEYRG